MKYVYGFFAVFVLLSCSPAVTAPSNSNKTTGTVADKIPANIETDILGYVNEYRQSKGLGSLHMNSIASDQALQHSLNMARGRTPFSHNGFDERIANIKKQMRVSYLAAVAENVAEGQLSAREVVKGWLNSPGHKKNIEGNYNQTGIGVARSKSGDLYFTQIFLRK